MPAAAASGSLPGSVCVCVTGGGGVRTPQTLRLPRRHLRLKAAIQYLVQLEGQEAEGLSWFFLSWDGGGWLGLGCFPGMST